MEKDPLPSLTLMTKFCNDVKKDFVSNFFLAPCADFPFLEFSLKDVRLYKMFTFQRESSIFNQFS